MLFDLIGVEDVDLPRGTGTCHAVCGAAEGADHPRVPFLPHVHGSRRRDPVSHADREGGNAEVDGAMTSHRGERVDVLVLGSGEGGKYLAWHMAKAGHRTVVVERRWIGGSCPDVNCLPSKNEVWSAKIATLVKDAAEFGMVTGAAVVDNVRVRERKRHMVDGLIAMHLERYKASGAELVMGTGRFVAPKTLEVRLNDGGTRVLSGDRVFLDVGTHATIPPIPDLAAAAPLTHIGALELDRVPPYLIVLGGGYVGLELAQTYRRFGSRVTIVEQGPRLAGREDPDVADAIARIFSDEGIEVLVAAETRRVKGRSGQGVSVTVRTAQGDRTIEGSDILVAAGRTPNTAAIGLDKAGNELDAHGYVAGKERLETRAPEGWGPGGRARRPQVTPVAFRCFPGLPRKPPR